MNANEVSAMAAKFVASENAELAKGVLEAFLADTDHPAIWLQYGRLLLLLGEEVAARAVIRNVVLKTQKPHIVDIIAARIPVGKPIVVEPLKLVYFNIPKCGSSTLKDAILVSQGEARQAAASHFAVSRFEKVLPFAEFDKSYADYESIMIVRHPRERLRSYWQKNIQELGSLANECGRRDSYYGLATRPAYNDVLRNFRRYRQVFRDFRHHTDSITGYAGYARRVKHVLEMSDLQKAISLLKLPPSVDTHEFQNMRSWEPFDDSKADTALEKDLIGEHYKAELGLYFA